MQHYQNSVQDRFGNAQAGKRVLVSLGGLPATIYSDNGVTPKSNPITTDADGSFDFYAANGDYVLTVDGSDATPVRLLDPTDAPDAAATSSDKVFGIKNGEAVQFPASPHVNAHLWPSLAANGANWATRDSTMFVMSAEGKLGLVGAVKTSLLADVQYAPIAVAGFLIADHATKTGWAGYFDVQNEGGAQAYGIEIAAKNKTGVNTNPNAYSSGTNATHGAWVVAGGDATYGGAPTNPSAAGLFFVKNASTWNKGIVFGATSLTGTDGVTGVGIAISMAKGHEIEWQHADQQRSAAIRSDNATNTTAITQVFVANGVYFLGANSKRILQSRYTANAVNFVDTLAAVTGGSPTISAQGDDANVDLTLSGKGTGLVRFGTRTAITTETLSHYISAKAADGTAIKLAVVS